MKAVDGLLEGTYLQSRRVALASGHRRVAQVLHTCIKTSLIREITHVMRGMRDLE